MKNHYQTLGLEPGASADDIKKAYRSLANKYHPDKHVGSPDAVRMEEKFKEVKTAYEALTSPQSSQHDSDGFTPYYTHTGNFSNMDEIIKAMREAHTRQNSIPMVTIRVDLLTAFNGSALPINVYGKNVSYKLRPGMPSGVVFQDEISIEDKSKPIQIRLLIKQPGFAFRTEGSFDGQHFSGDIETQLEVDALEIMLGAWKQVKNFNGEMLNIRIPRGFEFHRQRLRIAGQGYSNWKGDSVSDRADVYVALVPKISRIDEVDPLLVDQLYNETRPKSNDKSSS